MIVLDFCVALHGLSHRIIHLHSHHPKSLSRLVLVYSCCNKRRYISRARVFEAAQKHNAPSVLAPLSTTRSSVGSMARECAPLAFHAFQKERLLEHFSRACLRFLYIYNSGNNKIVRRPHYPFVASKTGRSSILSGMLSDILPNAVSLSLAGNSPNRKLVRV